MLISYLLTSLLVGAMVPAVLGAPKTSVFMFIAAWLLIGMQGS